MNWKQVKEMHDNGMHIGSHTCDHIDCAKTDKNELVNQLTLSKKVIEKELNQGFTTLAYPFGGKENFNEIAKKEAINAGYNCILSAYGGINDSVEKYDIKRVGIDWTYSELAFQARLYGW